MKFLVDILIDRSNTLIIAHRPAQINIASIEMKQFSAMKHMLIDI